MFCFQFSVITFKKTKQGESVLGEKKSFNMWKTPLKGRLRYRVASQRYSKTHLNCTSWPTQVFLIVQPTKQHRIVWGSLRLMGDYENGMLRPTLGQELHSPEGTGEHSVEGVQNGPVVDPMTATPEQMVDMSPTLANVLGHVPNTHWMTEPTSPITGFENIPNPVREVLRRTPRARLNFNEMAPVIREQTEITFVSDENVITAGNNLHDNEWQCPFLLVGFLSKYISEWG